MILTPQARHKKYRNRSPAQPVTVLQASLGLSGGIRYVLYTEETSLGPVLHRCLCPGTHICAWKIPTPDFSITEPSAQRDRFFSNKKALSLQVPYYIFYKHIHAPTHTQGLKAALTALPGRQRPAERGDSIWTVVWVLSQLEEFRENKKFFF